VRRCVFSTDPHPVRKRIWPILQLPHVAPNVRSPAEKSALQLRGAWRNYHLRWRTIMVGLIIDPPRCSCIYPSHCRYHYLKYIIGLMRVVWSKLAMLIVKGKGKGAYSSSWNSPQNYETPLVKWDHTVLSATRQRWPPRLHPNRAGWYSIYRPHKDERLSWPSWLVTYRNGLPVHRRLPIRVLTGSDVAQLRWSKPSRYH